MFAERSEAREELVPTNRLVTLDASDRIVAEGRIPLTPAQVDEGYWFFNMGLDHPDRFAPIDSVVIP